MLPNIQQQEIFVWGLAAWGESLENIREFGKMELKTVGPILPQGLLSIWQGEAFSLSSPLILI